MIVLDASAAVNLLIDVPVGAVVAERLLGERSVHVPAHFDFEVFATVRKLTLRRLLSAHEARSILVDLNVLSVVRWPAADFLPRAHDLRDSVSAGDALYITLAEALDAPLVTCDSRLGGSNAHDARVEVIS